jgi:hypothetical protein
MKSIQLLTLLCLFSLSTTKAQNWEATNLTLSNAFPITDMHTHDGNLFATVNQVFLGTLEMSDDDGQTWTTQAITNVAGFPQFMSSVGNRLYMSSNNTFHGILYYSEDNGATFTEDINGLPAGIGGGTGVITSVQILGNILVVGLGSGGYYAKPTSNLAEPFVQFDTPTSLNAGTDRLAYHNGILYTYDNAGAKLLYVSTDFGTTWSVPDMTNLPTDLQSDILEINPTNGRIYLSGESSFSGNVAANYGLYYSDDGGVNWTQMDLSMVAATNYLGDFHKVTALYVNNNLFFAAFDNDAMDTEPDVISSTNFPIVSPSIDNTGLVVDPSGTVHGRKFQIHNQKIVLSLNLVDVYIKDTTLSDQNLAFQSTFEIYPTIVTDNQLYIDSTSKAQLDIIDSIGKTMLKISIIEGVQVVDISLLSNGVYILRLYTEHGMVAKRIVKKS